MNRKSYRACVAMPMNIVIPGRELIPLEYIRSKQGLSSNSFSSGMMQGLRPTTRDSYGRLVLGDVITSLNGQKVTNGSDLYKILDRCKVGDTVSFIFDNPSTTLQLWNTFIFSLFSDQKVSITLI